MNRYMLASCTIALTIGTYMLVLTKVHGREPSKPYCYLYNPNGPPNKTGFMTPTNYIQVPLNRYPGTDQTGTREFGLITTSETIVPGYPGKFPDFSQGKITFNRTTGFPNGGTDFLKNDTKD